MISRVIALLCSITLLGCGAEKSNDQTREEAKDDKCSEVIEYYEDGQISHKGKFCEGLEDGEHIWYRKDGSKKTLAQYNQGEFNGIVAKFNSKGDTTAVQFYSNGSLTGKTILFDYEKRTREVTESVIIEGQESHKNQWWVYDLMGNLDKEKSHFYEIVNPKDIYSIGATDSLKIRLTAPLFDYGMYVVIGKINEMYSLTDKKSYREFEGNDDFTATIPIKTDSIGIFKLRFIINDYRPADSLGENVVESKPLLGEYEYTVK